jgi:hypothetical protein
MKSRSTIVSIMVRHRVALFDQVLVRHEAQSLFIHPSLEILESDGTDDFRSARGIPRRGVYSDHLPILLKLDA